MTKTETTSVRVAMAEDAVVIAELLAQLGYPTEPTAIPARLAAIGNEGGIALVAVDQHERVIGLGTGARHATLHAGDQVAYITALVTAEDRRGHGVGRALVTAIERWAGEHNCRRLSVTSAEHRADAHAFYPRCGFPYTGRRFTKDIQPVSRD